MGKRYCSSSISYRLLPVVFPVVLVVLLRTVSSERTAASIHVLPAVQARYLNKNKKAIEMSRFQIFASYTDTSSRHEFLTVSDF